MRINWSDEEDFPGQFFLWEANCRRSISGCKGQTALRELEAALLALPTKRLIRGYLESNGDVCAVGALARYKKHNPIADVDSTYQTERIGVECGMPRLVAWEVVAQNDIIMEEGTPEQRYTDMLKWVQKQIRSTESK